MLVSFYATFSGEDVSIAVTPMSFMVTLLLNGIAIFQLHVLDIKPIATQHILNAISDSYVVLSDMGLVVKYNHNAFEYYEALGMNSTLDAEAYLTIAKLTAILRVANGLDRSHKQKFQNVKTTLKEGKLIIHVDTEDDITLEKGLFQNRADFFEEVFSVRPTIRQKKSL